MPVAPNKVADIASISDTITVDGGVFRVLIDHPTQVRSLEQYGKSQGTERRWSAFVKINGGQKFVHSEVKLTWAHVDHSRAGIIPTSPEFRELLRVLYASPSVSVYGFYAHAGNSYASTSFSEASSFLSSEIQSVNLAARIALDELSKFPNAQNAQRSFVLSVGSTPTAHAVNPETRRRLDEELCGALELHAGETPELRNIAKA